MSKAEFVPAIGEQFNSVWKRGLSYNGFDMKFFTKKSHFEMDIALQSCYYGMEGVGKKAETTFREGNSSTKVANTTRRTRRSTSNP